MDRLDNKQSVIYEMMPDSSQDTLSMSTDDKYNSFIMTYQLCTDIHARHSATTNKR